MNRVRRLAAWAAAALLLLAPGIRARAEVTADKTESRGRVTEINWRDENGNPAAGPEGYATVRYEYGYNKTTETYYDAEGFPYEKHGIDPNYRWRDAWQDIFFWHWEGHTIWGLTAAIVEWMTEVLLQ